MDLQRQYTFMVLTVFKAKEDFHDTWSIIASTSVHISTEVKREGLSRHGKCFIDICLHMSLRNCVFPYFLITFTNFDFAKEIISTLWNVLIQ